MSLQLINQYYTQLDKIKRYRKRSPPTPTIAEMFNTYKFSDYKEQVIDLLKRVCTVSAETMKIVGEMEGLNE